MRVIADRTKCCGGGQCVLSAPGVFDQDEDGIVLLLREIPDAGEEADVRKAAHVCPSRCIELQP